MGSSLDYTDGAANFLSCSKNGYSMAACDDTIYVFYKNRYMTFDRAFKKIAPNEGVDLPLIKDLISAAKVNVGSFVTCVGGGSKIAFFDERGNYYEHDFKESIERWGYAKDLIGCDMRKMLCLVKSNKSEGSHYVFKYENHLECFFVNKKISKSIPLLHLEETKNVHSVVPADKKDDTYVIVHGNEYSLIEFKYGKNDPDSILLLAGGKLVDLFQGIPEILSDLAVGEAKSISEKSSEEAAKKLVKGVTSIYNEISMRIASENKQNDTSSVPLTSIVVGSIAGGSSTALSLANKFLSWRLAGLKKKRAEVDIKRYTNWIKSVNTTLGWVDTVFPLAICIVEVLLFCYDNSQADLEMLEEKMKKYCDFTARRVVLERISGMMEAVKDEISMINNALHDAATKACSGQQEIFSSTSTEVATIHSRLTSIFSKCSEVYYCARGKNSICLEFPFDFISPLSLVFSIHIATLDLMCLLPQTKYSEAVIKQQRNIVELYPRFVKELIGRAAALEITFLETCLRDGRRYIKDTFTNSTMYEEKWLSFSDSDSGYVHTTALTKIKVVNLRSAITPDGSPATSIPLIMEICKAFDQQFEQPFLEVDRAASTLSQRAILPVSKFNYDGKEQLADNIVADRGCISLYWRSLLVGKISNPTLSGNVVSGNLNGGDKKVAITVNCSAWKTEGSQALFVLQDSARGFEVKGSEIFAWVGVYKSLTEISFTVCGRDGKPVSKDVTISKTDLKFSGGSFVNA